MCISQRQVPGAREKGRAVTQDVLGHGTHLAFCNQAYFEVKPNSNLNSSFQDKLLNTALVFTDLNITEDLVLNLRLRNTPDFSAPSATWISILAGAPSPLVYRYWCPVSFLSCLSELSDRSFLKETSLFILLFTP